MIQKKPFLIRLIGIIELIKSIYGIFGIFIGLIGIFALSRIGIGSQITIIILSLASRLVSIVALIGAIAVIRYKPIGRKIIIFVGSISILLTLISIAYTLIIFGVSVWYSYIMSSFSIIYYGAVIGYFMTSEVRNVFETQNPEL